MFRPASLAAIALGFLTAFAVGQLGMLVAEPVTDTVPALVRAPNVEEIASDFYGGIDDWIDADNQHLDQLVTPEFVDHSLAGAPDRDRAAFFANLTAIRDAAPDLQLEIEHIDTVGSIVSVDLTGSPGNIATLPGWSLTLPAQSAFREVLRIDGDRVAERWRAGDLWPYGRWSVEQAVNVGFYQLRQPSIQRFEVASETEIGIIVSGTVVVLVELGTVGIDLSGHDLAGQVRPAYVPIGAGEVRVVETAGSLKIHREGGGKATFWTVALDQILPPVAPADSPSDAPPIGIQQTANIGAIVSLPQRNVRVWISSITLPAGTEMRTRAPGMHSVAVLDGRLEGVAGEETVYFTLDETSHRGLDGAEMAEAGQGFVATLDGSATFYVVGTSPVTLLLLTVLPVSPPGNHPVRAGLAWLPRQG